MTNWVPNISFIQNGQLVNQTNIGSVTGGLKQRTDYLYEQLNNLQVENLIAPGIPCNSSVVNQQVGYLNPANGLVELANGGATDTASVVGIVLNKRNVAGGFVCDLLYKGLYRIPATSLGTVVEENSWSRGGTLYLSTTDGKLTFVEPPLSVPMGIALDQDSSLNYMLLFDSDPYLNLQHRHTREVFTWIPTTSGGTGAYTLTYEPVLPSSVFAMIDGNPLIFDDDNVGAWVTPGDPEFTVSGTTIQIYTPNKHEINPYDPKLEVWYSYPFGNSGGVRGLVAGYNIDLSSCCQQGQVQSGIVTVNSVQQLRFITDDSETNSIKSISIDPTDKAMVITQGANTNKLTPGIGIYMTNDSPTGQGNFTINARRDRDSYEDLVPDSIFLENSKQNFLFDRWHVYSLEFDETQEATMQWSVPPYANISAQPKLVLDYMVGSQDSSADVELQIQWLLLNAESTLADAATSSMTTTIPVAVANYKQKKRVTISLGFDLVRDSSLVLIVNRTGSGADLYEGDFNILHARLRITPDAI